LLQLLPGREVLNSQDGNLDPTHIEGVGIVAYFWHLFAERHHIQYAFSGTFVILLRSNQIGTWNMEIAILKGVDCRRTTRRTTSEPTVDYRLTFETRAFEVAI
jgi:hypothetical protein